MPRLILAAFLAFATTFAQAEVIDIDNAELDKLVKRGVPVIDIRTLPEWEETGIISGSRLITFFDERGRSDPAAWLEKIKPVAKPNEPVIVICRSGNRTKPVSQFLSQQAGYTQVYNVKNGIKGWSKENGPLTPATQSIAACRAAKSC
jgi:rhodanese-related sulfurtransferase